jgi:hypothetical protein
MWFDGLVILMISIAGLVVFVTKSLLVNGSNAEFLRQFNVISPNSKNVQNLPSVHDSHGHGMIV